PVRRSRHDLGHPVRSSQRTVRRRRNSGYPCVPDLRAALAHANTLDAAPQPAPDTWRSLTSRNAHCLLDNRAS
ncbi:hypothetical protein ABT074_42900, partial [Streptomyces sp. NPDC002205]